MSNQSHKRQVESVDMDSLETIEDGNLSDYLELESVDDEEAHLETAIINDSDNELVSLAAELNSDTETLAPPVAPVVRRGSKSAQPKAQPNRRRGRQAIEDRPKPSRRSKQFDAFERESDELERVQGNGFMRRWIAAWFGIILVWAAYAAVQWELLLAAWKPILSQSKISENEHYAFFGACVFLIAFSLGLIVACFDRSALRCIQLGIAWCAIGIICITFLSIQQPAKVSKDDRVDIGLALLQSSLAPAIHAHALERQQLHDQIQLLRNSPAQPRE